MLAYRACVWCNLSINSLTDKGGATVVFKDVCVSLGKKDILNNVYGMAKVGQMLAIMGPSGTLII